MKRKILNIIKIVVLLSVFFGTLNISNTTFATDTNQTLEDGVYTIKSALNEKFVFDIYSSLKTNDAKVELWTGGGTKNQKFTLKYIGDGCYTISPVHSGKFIDVANNSKKPGAQVLQYEYHGGDNQKWIIKDAGNGYFNIISKSNGLYLDIPHSDAHDGSLVQVWTSNGCNNQKFKFVKDGEETPTGTKTINDGTYQIQTAEDTSKVVDIGGSSTQDGTNIGVWENSSTANQKFNIKYRNDGYYTISAMHSGKYIDVAGSSKQNGATVDQWEYHGGNNQQWVIRDAGNGYYYIISKCNGLYLTVDNGRIVTSKLNNSSSQKFKLTVPTAMKGTKTLEDGTYTIASVANTRLVIDIPHSSKDNGEKIELWKNGKTANQKFNIKYVGDGYYTITATHANTSIELANGTTIIGTKITQYANNGSDAQKWIIKEAGNGEYYIISKNSELYMTVENEEVKEGANLTIQNYSGRVAQKFTITDSKIVIDIDDNKYPGYKAALEKLLATHPNWNVKFLYTGLKFDSAVAGEAEVHGRNLVETSNSGEWVCSTCGTQLYDSGWYCASEKAIAYYMDPRNFFDEVNIFQFQDVNEYLDEACTLEGIKAKVKGTYLEKYADDIEKACRNTNVNPYYIIARLIQEQGNNGTQIGRGMDGGDGKTYYNPFNISANGTGWEQIYANALARAKKEGWDTMQKALEGGIGFCKDNWLENYQNTLYQNRFDIDSTNGTSLYTHQYMQNLMGAYSEAKTLQSMYKNTSKLDSSFTFIIPLYEQMNKTVTPLPSASSETYPINVATTGTNVLLRSGPSTSSDIIKTITDKGTVFLSIERGINSDWQKVVTPDGTIGYMSGKYLKQIDDVKTCDYKANVKTNDGYGCNVRIGPSTDVAKLTALAENAEVTVIDNSTYKNINGYDWYRIIISDGRQAFIPSKYLR